jgi:sterol desaturase/sphingolipid hydroxylase (fatty acid hydroxylase superfamily)
MRQSAVSYFADMVMCPLVVLGLSAFALTHFTRAAMVEWALLVSFGCAFWTLVEYAMHRLIYHRIPAFERYHQIHHENPRAYVGAPPLLGTTVTFLVSFMPLVAFAPIVANGFSAGMLSGYTLYMFIHYAIHFWDPTPGSFLYRARLHHAVHHYRDGNGNFGVTTSFWDRVFGTRISSARAFA